MKYCVIANLKMNLPAQVDKLQSDILAHIANKLTWGAVHSTGITGEDGKPAHSLSIRFEHEEDMNILYDFIKDRMIKIPVLGGKVSKHPCPHDIGGVPCAISEEYVKEI